MRAQNPGVVWVTLVYPIAFCFSFSQRACVAGQARTVKRCSPFSAEPLHRAVSSNARDSCQTCNSAWCAVHVLRPCDGCVWPLVHACLSGTCVTCTVPDSDNMYSTRFSYVTDWLRCSRICIWSSVVVAVCWDRLVPRYRMGAYAFVWALLARSLTTSCM